MDDQEQSQLQQNEPDLTQQDRTYNVPERTKVTFPRKKSSKLGIGLIIPIILLLLLAVGRFVFFGKEKEDTSSEVSPTPLEENQNPTPSPSPTPAIERDEIIIEVLNGTGLSGEAAFLKDELKNLGYTSVEIGNADKQNYDTAKVVFSDDLAEPVEEEILGKLESLYQDVESSTESLSGKDVQIYTGLRAGQTFPPTDTPVPTASLTATPTPTSSVTGTPTSTATPSATLAP